MRTIDIHAHVLPNIDDGAENITETRLMLAELVNQNVDRIIFTPHFYSDSETVDEFIARRDNSFENIKNDIRGCGLQYYLGAEVFLTKFLFRQKNIEKLLISETRYMLLELPYDTVDIKNKIHEYIPELIKLNIKPIIAHAERFGYLFKQGLLKYLKDKGCLFQINAASVLNKKYALKIRRITKKASVDFIASDAHNMITKPVLIQSAIEAFDKKYKAIAIMARMNSIDFGQCVKD